MTQLSLADHGNQALREKLSGNETQTLLKQSLFF